jgi:hypothetical protein
MTARRSRPDASTSASSGSLPVSTKSEQSHNPPRGTVTRGASRRRSAQLHCALHRLQSVQTDRNQRIHRFLRKERLGQRVGSQQSAASGASSSTPRKHRQRPRIRQETRAQRKRLATSPGGALPRLRWRDAHHRRRSSGADDDVQPLRSLPGWADAGCP